MNTDGSILCISPDAETKESNLLKALAEVAGSDVVEQPTEDMEEVSLEVAEGRLLNRAARRAQERELRRLKKRLKKEMALADRE